VLTEFLKAKRKDLFSFGLIVLLGDKGNGQKLVIIGRKNICSYMS